MTILKLFPQIRATISSQMQSYANLKTAKPKTNPADWRLKIRQMHAQNFTTPNPKGIANRVCFPSIR